MTPAKLTSYLLASLCVLLLTMLISLNAGSCWIPLQQVLSTFSDLIKGTSIDSPEYYVIIRIRVPRILLAALVGASLALSGLVFQAILRNPLADPYLLGISSGSALGVVVFTTTGIFGSIFYAIPLSALAGGLISVLIVFYFIPWTLFKNRISLSSDIFILSGVITSLLFGSLIIFLISFSDTPKLQKIFYWLMGSLCLADEKRILSALPYFVFALPVFFFHSKALNLIQLGDEAAISLGINPFRVKKRLLVIASVLTSAVVAVSGTIGFIGLIIPHFTKLMSGYDNRANILLAPIWGATFLITADSVARLLSTQMEIPVGAVTTILGTPAFVFILTRKRNYT